MRIKILTSIVLLFFPLVSFAASVQFRPEKPITGVGQETRVFVDLKTGNASINAVEGNISFPENSNVVRIEDGNSVVSLWLERPHIIDGKIVFSGIIPGGYQGQQGILFALVLKTTKEGQGALSSDVRLLNNDGTGSDAKIEVSPLSISVRGTSAVTAEPLLDREKPESFAPTIGRSDELFDGAWFVAFVTQDKGSGIDYYTVQESGSRIGLMFAKKQRVESPYALKSQDGQSYVRVVAYDKVGNSLSEIATPPVPRPWYFSYDWWFGIGALFLILIGLNTIRNRR